MLDYDFEIIYKKGKRNVVVDAFIRKDEDVEALFCVISIIQLDWINEARDEWKKDEEVWPLIQKLQKIPVQTILLNLMRKEKSYWNLEQSQKQEPDNYEIDQF